jgi:hypothetical protein
VKSLGSNKRKNIKKNKCEEGGLGPEPDNQIKRKNIFKKKGK